MLEPVADPTGIFTDQCAKVIPDTVGDDQPVKGEPEGQQLKDQPTGEGSVAAG